MPELPEVETTLRGVQPFIEQQTIRRITIRDARLRWPIPAAVQQARGALVTGCRRRAKYMIFDTNRGGSLLVHLGMSGSLRVITDGAQARKHDHFDIELDEAVLRFNDPRRFGALLWAELPVESHALLNHLGPEPLTDAFNAQQLWSASRGKRLAVKNFIMDGRVVVGVGNIYASEALYMAGINPKRAAGRVSLARYAVLVDAIREVLSHSIRQGGTTLRDYVNSTGEPGYFALNLLVYGRQGEPCFQCGQPIRQITLGQRSSFYCVRCQR
jgi:formamidopyrimidine-DNA glycosylase